MRYLIAGMLAALVLTLMVLTGCTRAKGVIGGQHEEFTEMGKNAHGLMEYKHNQTGILFVLIPDGTFKMGSAILDQHWTSGSDLKMGWNNNHERPVHSVTINGFLMAKFEVTQGVWQAIMGNNPSCFNSKKMGFNTDNYPVDQVSWYDCITFCTKTGLRLPTEAEWEYTCRAGTTTKYYWGDKIDGDYLWYEGNSGYTTHPIGQKKSNGFGLYDMAGNIWEYCHDWYGDYTSTQINPTGPAGGSERVVRGGCFSNSDGSASAARDSIEPNRRDGSCGIRCACDLPRKK